MQQLNPIFLKREALMREPCSPAVERALCRLQEGRTPDAVITGADLLGALTVEEDGRAATLLLAHGLNIDSLSAKRSTVIDLARLLADARALARGHDTEGTVTSEYLLLELIEQDEGLRDSLTAGGLDFGALRNAVASEEPLIAAQATELELADTSDRFQIARVLDVNLNRARESLRTLDDFARFIRDDAHLTTLVKHLRHELVELAELLPASLLLHARDTIHDVGTAISTIGEMSRTSPSQVALVNVKRLQESLRSLEEYGKVIDSVFAAGVEQLRYRAYTLEKAIAVTPQADLESARLYVLLTSASCVASLEWTIAEAAAGGASIFQLREKGLDDRELLKRARDVRRWTRDAGALFILNDRPDIARLAEADGVHLGQDDLTLNEARQILGAEGLIGISTHTILQVKQALDDGADYIGIGPTFTSTTKQFTELAGLAFIREAVALTRVPAFAIGGINRTNAAQVAAAGAKRVAVSAAITQVDDPRAAAAELCALLHE